MYKLKKSFLVFVFILHQEFLFSNDIVVVRLRDLLTDYRNFDESKLDLFISDSKWALLEDAKLAIMEALSCKKDNDDRLILLQELKIKFESKIQVIKSQIKNNYRFDKKALNGSVVATSVFLVLSYLTYKSYNNWLLSNQKSFEDIEKNLKDKGIKKREYTRYYGSSEEHITEFIHEENRYVVDHYNYPELQELCKKYLSLEGSQSFASFCTKSMGVISTLSLLFSLGSFYDLATLDPNKDNKYLVHYQELLDFVVLLKKEYKKNQKVLNEQAELNGNSLQNFIDESRNIGIKKIFDEELQMSLIAALEEDKKKNIDDFQKLFMKINFMIKDDNPSSSKVDLYLRKLKFERKLSQSNDPVACAYVYYKHNQRVIPDVTNCILIAAGKYGLLWGSNGDCYSNELFKTKFYLTKNMLDLFSHSSAKEIDDLYNKYLDMSVFQLLPKKTIRDFSLTCIPYTHRSYNDTELSNLIWYFRYNPVRFLTECKNFEIKKIQKIIKETISQDIKSIEEMIKVLQSLQKILEREIKANQDLLKHSNSEKQFDDEPYLQIYQKLLDFITEEQKGFNILL